MIPLISEHDTWISLDPVIGCPADCSYCFVQRFGKTHSRPQTRISPEQAVELLLHYLDEDNRVRVSNDCDDQRRITRIVCLGNYTDMFLTKRNRQYALTYAELHHTFLPALPLVFVTKAALDAETIYKLDALGHAILIFISQSFLTEREVDGHHFERGTASSQESCKNFRLISESKNLKPLHFWRPLTRINLPDERTAIRQVELVRDSGAIASVAVGLKHGDFLLSAFMDPKHPLHSVLLEHTDTDSPEGEIFPVDVRERALRAGLREHHPVYLNTSCAVSRALNVPDFLGTWQSPIRELRCEPASCPDIQRTLCFRQKPNEPTAECLNLISSFLSIPQSAVRWDATARVVSINSVLAQDVQCRLAHLTGLRIQPLALDETREWIGSFCGIGKSMNQTGIEVNLPPGAVRDPLYPLIERHRRITGLLTPIGPPEDHRGPVFSRYFHIRRVTTIAVGLALQVARYGDDFIDINRVRYLAWLHDLNRWPFAHNSEKGLYNQIEDLPCYFKRHDINIDERDQRDLIYIHRKVFDELSIEGKIVCAADRGAGITEDIIFSLTALNIPLTLIPADILKNLGLLLERNDLKHRLSEIKTMFDDPTLIENYRLSVDRIVTGYTHDLIARFCKNWPSFEIETDFLDLISDAATRFLHPVLFPIVNDRIGKGQLLREHIIVPLIRELRENYLETLTSIDDRQALDLALHFGVICESDLTEIYPDFNYLAHHPL